MCVWVVARLLQTKINIFWKKILHSRSSSGPSTRKKFKKRWFQPLRQTVHCPAKMRPKLWKSHIVLWAHAWLFLNRIWKDLAIDYIIFFSAQNLINSIPSSSVASTPTFELLADEGVCAFFTEMFFSFSAEFSRVEFSASWESSKSSSFVSLALSSKPDSSLSAGIE